MKNVAEYAACRENAADLSLLYERALEAGERELYIPAGEYILHRPLRLKSDMSITADGFAHITAADGEFQKEDSFLICGYNIGNVRITGGHWDGNVAGNPRESYKSGAQTGVSFEFGGVRDLVISGLTMTDPGSYHIRIGASANILIENIVFDDRNYCWCQDGIHIGGFCENIVIRGISTKGMATNDDLVALNADDIFRYSQNRGMTSGYIRHVLIEDLYGEAVYTGVRLLSTVSEISDVTVRNVRLGVRYYFLNLDGARYASDGFYAPGEYPEICGKIRNVTVENAEVRKVTGNSHPLIVFETRADNFRLKNLRRLPDAGDGARVPTARFRNIPTCRVRLNGRLMPDSFETDCDGIAELSVDSEPWED